MKNPWEEPAPEPEPEKEKPKPEPEPVDPNEITPEQIAREEEEMRAEAQRLRE